MGALFRITYGRYRDLLDDVTTQMSRGGLLVRVSGVAGLALDEPVGLELVLPDRTVLAGASRVIQQLATLGVAVTVPPELVEQARQLAISGSDPAGDVAPMHERFELAMSTRDGTTPVRPRAVTTTPPRSTNLTAQHQLAMGTRDEVLGDLGASRAPTTTSTNPQGHFADDILGIGLDAVPVRATAQNQLAMGTRDELLDGQEPALAVGAGASPVRSRAPTTIPETATNAQKIHLAMHGSRDERSAVLRDQNRTLHPFVLKNPQLTVDEVLEISKQTLSSPMLLKLVAGRKDWFQRSDVALALARNPKTPADIAVRALEYVTLDALRLMAKGTGVLPHVSQAARKKVLK